MIISSTFAVFASVLGALSAGAIGTVRGMAVAGGFSALVWWWQLHAALRESRFAKQAALLRSDKPAGRHRAGDPATPRPADDQRKPARPDHTRAPRPLWSSEWRS
jgi:hypothetical protein